MDDSRIKDAASLLSAFFDEEKLRMGSRYTEFFTSWTYLVGERLAAHSRIADIDKGILVVEAEHPGWIQLLQFRQTSILEGVKARFPEFELRSIVFRLGMRTQRNSDVPDLKDSNIGPFGPGAASVQEDIPGAAEQSTSENLTTSNSKRVSLENIADPEFRNLLLSLKRTVEGKDER